MVRIALISDLHFTDPSYEVDDFFSKAFIAKINWHLTRKKKYGTDHLAALPSFLKKSGVDLVAIMGDFTTTSTEHEFQSAVEFTKTLELPILTLPGNHDFYTKRAQSEARYFRYFPNDALQQERIALKEIGRNWWWLAIHAATLTPPFYAYGIFSQAMRESLIALLNQIPKEDSVIIACHFPLLPFGKPRNELRGASDLLSTLQKFPQVKLYLHGHDHTPKLHSETHPIVLCAGSVADMKYAPLHLITLHEEGFVIEAFLKEKDSWELTYMKGFSND